MPAPGGGGGGGGVTFAIIDIHRGVWLNNGIAHWNVIWTKLLYQYLKMQQSPCFEIRGHWI